MSLYVVVGSTNPVKRAGVKAAFDAFQKQIQDSVEFGFSEVSSGVSAQPFSLEEMMIGAQKRAQNAFNGCNLSIGIESGIFALQDTYMDTCHIALYTGAKFYNALGSVFEIPERLVNILKKGGELGDHFNKHGEGAIGFLTRGIVTRQDQVKQGTMLAIARYLNKDYA